MNDRELLEMAAKAAGISNVIAEDGDGSLVIQHGAHFRYFNPLAHDGDALRLAVKLGLEIDIGVSCVIVWKRKSLGEFEQHITGKHDPYAATRRAIVRAAAEIGRAMP